MYLGYAIHKIARTSEEERRKQQRQHRRSRRSRWRSGHHLEEVLEEEEDDDVEPMIYEDALEVVKYFIAVNSKPRFSETATLKEMKKSYFFQVLIRSEERRGGKEG